MFKKSLKFLTVALCASMIVAANAGVVRSASAILTSAELQAKHENKKVLVIFHASWCGWCKKLEGMLNDPQVGKIMGDNYVIEFMTVLENGDKKALENGGAAEYMKQLGGEKAGLPFYAILDKNGKKLADSNYILNGKETNIGYPGTADEISRFMAMLKSTAPRLDSSKQDVLSAWLKTNAPAH